MSEIKTFNHEQGERCEVKAVIHNGMRIRLIQYEGRLWYFSWDISNLFGMSNIRYFSRVAVNAKSKMLVVKLSESEVLVSVKNTINFATPHVANSISKTADRGQTIYVLNDDALFEIANRAKSKRQRELRTKIAKEFIANLSTPKAISAKGLSPRQLREGFMRLSLESAKGKVNIEINASELTDIQKKTIRHIFMELTRYIA